VKLLAERGAAKSLNDRPQGNRGEKTALRLATLSAPAIAEVLLDHGAEIDHDDGVFTGHALNAALFEENAEVARLLIERGADLQLKSAIGKVPPMVWSAYRETEDTLIAEMLLKKGADINAANEYGETALTWARKRGHQRMAGLLLEAAPGSPRPRRAGRSPAATSIRPPPGAPATSSPQWRRASASSSGARTASWSSGECVSCHHQFLPAMALGWARDRGFLLNEESLRRQVDRQVHLWSARKNQALEMQQPVPVPPHFLGAGLLGLAAVGYPPDDMTEAMASYLASTQGADGHWVFGSRPPLDHGAISATVKALRVLQVYPVEALRTEFAERVGPREGLAHPHDAAHAYRAVLQAPRPRMVRRRSKGA
jgi:hypothetical protein